MVVTYLWLFSNTSYPVSITSAIYKIKYIQHINAMMSVHGVCACARQTQTWVILLGGFVLFMFLQFSMESLLTKQYVCITMILMLLRRRHHTKSVLYFHKALQHYIRQIQHCGSHTSYRRISRITLLPL